MLAGRGRTEHVADAGTVSIRAFIATGQSVASFTAFAECCRAQGGQMPDDHPDHAPLKIAGFGACMITGYPHKSGSFFTIACNQVAEDLACPVESKIFSFGGFPAPRAGKYLEPKVRSYAPNYVIIQFASLDALCPVRRSSLSISSSSVRGVSGAGLGSPASVRNTDNTGHQGKPATPWAGLRWELASLWGYLRRLEPTTPLSAYLPAMERMIDSCIAANATPIVLTPFVYGSRYSMASGVTYANALRELIANKRGAALVDCIEVLRTYPKRAVLQYDGFHLSKKGHEVVGLAVAQRITSHLQGPQIDKASPRPSDDRVVKGDSTRIMVQPARYSSSDLDRW
jgi:hypothetical protein